MTRRWSLIAVIVGLAVALTFVLVDIGSSTAAGQKKVPAAAGSSRPAAPNLAGIDWWPAQERAGTVAVDVTGHHNAVLQGSASWADGPKGGGALKLDSTGWGWGDTGATLPDPTTSDFSVAAWVRLENPTPGRFYTAVSQDGNQSSTFMLQYCGDLKEFAFSFANGRAPADVVGRPLLDHWYHLVGTYQHATGMLTVYVDGVKAGSNQAPKPELPTGHLVIGRGEWQGKQTDFWNGSIADVHVYDRALSPDEVTLLAAEEPSRRS